MPKVPENRERRLLELARAMDDLSESRQDSADGDSAENESAEWNDLNETERAELLRIQGALDFIRDIRPNITRPSENETLGNSTGDTPHPHASSKTGETLSGRELTSIGRFQIIRKLGQGGFAVVWLAFDPVLHRNVAIKAPKSSLFSSPESIARFAREAQAAAVLSHPGIVPVFEASSRDGAPFMVSAYCPGETLEAWFENKNRKISCRLAAQIVSRLAEAIEHAHQRGVVHRDLKPANVLVETSKTFGSPTDTAEPKSDNFLESLRIADFGLAKYTESVDQLETTEGAIIGTPAYMSPEQAAGSPVITGASDIYSLGVILYELLTGRFPIIGKTHIDTLLAISRDEPARPTRFNKNVPVDLESICLKCLNKSPESRYASAHELAEDLHRWLGGLAIRARPISAVERIAKWCKRNPLVAVALAGMCVGLLVATWQWRNATVQWHNAQNQNARAESNLQLSKDAIREIVKISSDVTKVPPELRYKLLERAANLQSTLFTSGTPSDESVLDLVQSWLKLSLAMSDMRQFDEAIAACDYCNELLDNCGPLSVVEGARVEINSLKAVHLKDAGRIEESLAILTDESLFPGISTSARINTLISTGIAFEETGEYEQAWLVYQQAQILTLSLDQSNLFVNNQQARVNLYLGNLAFKIEKYAEARDYLSTANDLHSGIVERSPYHESMTEQSARILLGLARAEAKTDELTKALEHYQQAFDLFDFVAVRNVLKTRFRTQRFRTKLDMTALQLTAGMLPDAEPGIEALESAFAEFDETITEREEFGELLLKLYSGLIIDRSILANESTGISYVESARQLFDDLRQKNPDWNAPTEIQPLLEFITHDD